MKVEVAFGFSPNHERYLSVSFSKKNMKNTNHVLNKNNVKLTKTPLDSNEDVSRKTSHNNVVGL